MDSPIHILHDVTGFNFSTNIFTNINIQKCRNIIVELTSTLNMKYAVAEDFKKMYDYIFALLIHANLEKDMEMLDRAVSEIRDMRDIWKQIMGKTKGPQLTLDMK